MTGYSPEFDWHPNGEDSDNIVVRNQPAIAVYLNPHDEVVIRQEGHDYVEDQWVYIAKDNVPKVAQAILEAAGFEPASTHVPPLALPKPEPLSGSERQRRHRNKQRNGNGDGHVTESNELPLRFGTKGENEELEG